MQNKQTCQSSKELLCYCSTTNHDRLATIMRTCAITILVLAISKNCGVEATNKKAIYLYTSTTNSYMQESTNEFSLDNSGFNNHSLSNEYNLTTSKDNTANFTSNVYVEAVLDHVYNKIQLNITWKKMLGVDRAHSYEFKISPNSTLAHCMGKAFKITLVNQSATDILLPPLSNKYEIIPGCTYKIDIITHLGKSILDVFYTVPECINLSPRIEKFEAVEISHGHLNISWVVNKRGKDNKMYNITGVVFEYRPNTPQLNNNPFITLASPLIVTNGSNYFILNSTRAFTTGEEYQLKAVFTNAYNCQAYNYTNFTVVSAKMSLKDKQNFISDGKVRNIRVRAIYDGERKKILLNVTWEKPLDADYMHSYDFKVSPNDSNAYCMNQSFETIKKNKNLTSIVLPSRFHKYDISAGCTYKISIITDRFQLGKGLANIIYKVPECVGKKCNCVNLSPQFKHFEAAEISPGKLNISWELNQSSNNSQVYNITSAILEYRQIVSDQSHNNPYKLIHSSDSNLQRNYVILDNTSALIANERYELQAIFYNTYNCKVYKHTDFIVAVTKTEVHITQEPSNSSWIQLILFLLVTSLVVLAMIYIFRRNRLVIKEIVCNPLSLTFTRRRRRVPEARTSYTIVPTITRRQQETNIIYVDKEILDGDVDHYEFPRARISPKIRDIGEGAFGEVFLAKAFGIEQQPGYTYVAVKTLPERASPEEMDDFLSEIEIFKKVGEHPNIVRMFGCCVLKEPYLMVMEYVPCGDLKHYLLELREKWRRKRTRNDSTPVFSDASDGVYVLPDSPLARIPSEARPSVTETEYTTFESDGFPTPTEPFNSTVDRSLDHTELQYFALQIAKGMEHLEKIPIAHRDLAARNILITEYKTLKISDFGLSRVGPYVNSRTKKLPLRWVSLEAIEDNFYDSKGDVWSFAVVLWEIGTLGAFPYENVIDAMVPHFLSSGKRLSRPEICTDDLYSLMLRCWSRDPQLRPSFQELVELLDVKKRRIYVDFNQLNPLYVFPPSKVPKFDKRLNSLSSESTI